MEPDIEFQTFCKEAVSANSEILSKWISGGDSFKKTLAEFILSAGSEA